jgi:hypothetical protein
MKSTWLLILGIALLVVAGFLALAAMGEYSDYDALRRAGNPFASLKANSYIYLGGTALVGALAGVGLIIARDPSSVTSGTAPVGKRSNGWVWDGEHWISEAEWAARSEVQPPQ